MPIRSFSTSPSALNPPATDRCLAPSSPNVIDLPGEINAMGSGAARARAPMPSNGSVRDCDRALERPEPPSYRGAIVRPAHGPSAFTLADNDLGLERFPFGDLADLPVVPGRLSNG